MLVKRNNIILSLCALPLIITGCNSGGSSGGSTAPVTNPTAFILNQGSGDISVCPFIQAQNDFGPCSVMRPTTANTTIVNGTDYGYNPLLNGGSPVGIAINNNYAFISLDKGSNPLAVSQIVGCAIESNGQFDQCNVYNTSELNAQALRAFQPAIYNNILYFPTFGSGEQSKASIMACQIGANGGLSANSCTLYSSVYSASNTDFSLIAANQMLYGVSGATNVVNVIGLNTDGSLIPDSLRVSNAPNSNGTASLIDPRMMTITNGYAYITDPGQQNNANLVACQLTESGLLANCQPQQGQTSAGKNVFAGPVGIGSYQQTVFPLNWGYNGVQLGTSVALCAEGAGNAPLVQCSLSMADGLYGYSTPYIPIGIAVSTLVSLQ